MAVLSTEDMEYLYLSTVLAPYRGSLADLQRRFWLATLSLPFSDTSTNADIERLYYKQQMPGLPANWSTEDLEYEFYRVASALPAFRLSVQDYKREYYAART